MGLLPLETFRRIIGYHPWHFWGWRSQYAPVYSQCNDIVMKYSWQNTDAAGRMDIIEAIEQAEDKLKSNLGYPVAPTCLTSTVQWPRYFDRTRRRMISSDGSGRWIGLTLPYGHVQWMGVCKQELIENVRVVYSDEDNDNLDETFTITANTTITDPEEIAVYFQSSDRDGEDPTEDWRIKPIKVVIAAGVVTITGKAWMLMLPELQEGVVNNPTEPHAGSVDADESTNFVDHLDIYRNYINVDGTTIDDAQTVLVWETHPCHGQWCCCSSCDPTYVPDSSTDPAAVAYGIARAGIRDGILGEIYPGEAIRDVTTGLWSAIPWSTLAEPDKVVVHYQAGYPRDVAGSGDLAKRFQRLVAIMAAAEMPRRICACDTANKNLYRWQFDLARAAGNNDEQYRIADGDLSNPFGTRAGQVQAWHEVQTLRNISGFSV